MVHPVSVKLDDNNGQVLAAHGLFDQIIAFGNLGMTLAIFKLQRILSIAAMATGADGIHELDRLTKRKAVLGWDETFRYVYASSESDTIAVSLDNIVFISDDFDNRIRTCQNTGRKAIILC